METAQILQLVIGSGSLILLLRITFLVGQYANRIDTLERKTEDLSNEFGELRREFTQFRLRNS